MKIKHNTPDLLIVADIPWIFGIMAICFILVFMFVAMTAGGVLGVIFGFFGVICGGLAFIALARRTQIVLDRTRDALLVRRRSVFRYTSNSYPLSDLKAAVLDSHFDEDNQQMDRAVLEFKPATGGKRIPVTQSYTNTRGPRLAVDTINTWIAANLRA